MKRCFVIMPFSKSHPDRDEQYWTDHFEKFLKPTIESIGDIEVVRSEVIRKNIMKDVIHELITADIVVADLTDANPNVYYELGIRQSFKNGTITIAQHDVNIPFDISQKGILKYNLSKGLAGTKAFEKDLIKAIKHCIDKADECDSDVLDYVKGKHSLYTILNQSLIIRKINSLFIEYNVVNEYLNKIREFIEKDRKTAIYEINGKINLMNISLKNLITELYLDFDDQSIRIIQAYNFSIEQLNRTISHFSNLIISNYYTNNLNESVSLKMLDIVTKHIEMVESFAARYLTIISTSIERSGIQYNPFKEKFNA